MPRRTKEDAEKTRQDLLDCALDLFSAEGIGNVSLAQIAAAAGVTRGAVYFHFEGRDQILQELWETIFPMPLPTTAELGAGENPMDLIRQIMEDFLVKIGSEPRMQKLFRLTQQASADPKLAHAYSHTHERDEQELVEFLELAKARGHLREDISTHGAALAIFGSMEGIADHWLSSRRSMDLAKEAASLIAVLLRGLAPESD